MERVDEIIKRKTKCDANLYRRIGKMQKFRSFYSLFKLFNFVCIIAECLWELQGELIYNMKYYYKYFRNTGYPFLIHERARTKSFQCSLNP